MKNHWDTFWQSGEISSVPFSTENEYSSLLANYWIDFFKNQEDNSKLLDTATGNLIVPVFAIIANNNENKVVQVTATDLASIDPSAAMKKNPHLADYLKQVESFSHVNSEELPFEDSMFDMVTSMYGFEYSNIEKNMYEFNRVLKSRGAIKLLCHCYDSSIVLKNNLTKECIESILKGQLFNLLKALSESIGAIDTPSDFEKMKKSVPTEAKRKELNLELDKLHSNHKDALLSTKLVGFIQDFFASIPNSDHSTRTEKISAFKQQLEETKYRLVELHDAALSEEDISRLLLLAQNLEFTLSDNGRVTDSLGNILGIGFEFNKNS